MVDQTIRRYLYSRGPFIDDLMVLAKRGQIDRLLFANVRAPLDVAPLLSRKME